MDIRSDFLYKLVIPCWEATIRAFDWSDGEVFIIIDGDATIAVDKRDTAPPPGRTITAVSEQHVQGIWVKNFRQRRQ